MTMTIAAVCAVRLREQAKRAGLSEEVLSFAATGGDVLETRMRYEEFLALWERVMRAVDDPGFPIDAGGQVVVGDYDALGYACMTQRTVGEALRQCARYARFWTDASEWNVEGHEEGVSLMFACPGAERLAVRCSTECVLAEMLGAGRLLAGADFAALRVRFKHAAPRDTSRHEAFFRAPIEWGADRNELALRHEDAERALPKADPELAAYFDRHVQRVMARSPDEEDRVTARVRALLAEEVRRGAPTLESAAARLGMSSRTLKRRLQEEGTSFQDVLDGVRLDLAKRYLQEQRLALGEVAFLLGFSEPSAFHRAFKRWTGRTPLAFRQAPSPS